MNKRNLILEIGTEELPAAPLQAAIAKLADQAAQALEEQRLEHGDIQALATPRRIILKVDDLVEASEAQVQSFRGPSVAIAYDEQGAPTKAAQGFARGKGVAVEDLVRKMEGDTEYVYAEVANAAESALDLLPGLLLGLVEGIYWPRSQRWGNGTVHFARPVRWLVALFGDEVIPFTFGTITSDRISYGHRFLAPDPIQLADADALIPALQQAFVIPDQEERAQLIRDQIAAIEQETGLTAETPDAIFNEVVYLVEYPTVLVGHFDEEFLQVPPEIITDAMLSHQRYFPLYDKDGALNNGFLVTSNGNPRDSQTIIEGNERVVRARLYDAAFFYQEDLKRPLESYVDDLEQVVFQEKLGTTKAKVDRMVALAGALAEDAGADAQTQEDAKRAALLAKADLVTNAVVEFTSQQGIMGGYYAKAAGENDAVATAISEHYHPRFANDTVPSNLAGCLVAMADKLDTITGIFAIGQGPTGSSDPFALRRGAIGIINILLSGVPVNLAKAIQDAVEAYKASGLDFDPEATAATVQDFFRTRLEVMARETYTADTVNAVLATGVLEPVDALARMEALTQARANDPELFEDLAIAYGRANNLRDASLGMDFDEGLITEVEHALTSAITQAKSKVAKDLAADDYPAALAELASLRGPIDLFFEKVMVMDKDEALKNNRLRILNAFVDVFTDVADFGKLAG